MGTVLNTNEYPTKLVRSTLLVELLNLYNVDERLSVRAERSDCQKVQIYSNSNCFGKTYTIYLFSTIFFAFLGWATDNLYIYKKKSLFD